MPATRTPDGLQHLLAGANWDPDDIRDDLQQYVAEKLGEDGGVLIIDDTGFIKKGTTSAGRPAPVLRHRRPHRELPDRRLRRLRLAQRPGPGRPGAVPAQVLDRGPGPLPRGKGPRGAGVRHQGRTGPAHGAAGAGLTAAHRLGDRGLRLRAGMALAPHAGRGRRRLRPGRAEVPVQPWAADGSTRPFAQAPDEAWETTLLRRRRQRPRVYDWAAARLPAVDRFDYRARPTHRSGGYWPAAASPSRTRSPTTSPTHPSDHRRRTWCGSPGHAGRSRKSSRPRRTNAALTSTKSAAIRAGTGTSPWPCSRTPSWPPRLASPEERGRSEGTAGAIELTVAEVRRLLAACRPQPPHLRGHRGRHHALSWSNWRRRRQAVARRCHYLRRCRTTEGRSP